MSENGGEWSSGAEEDQDRCLRLGKKGEMRIGVYFFSIPSFRSSSSLASLAVCPLFWNFFPFFDAMVGSRAVFSILFLVLDVVFLDLEV